MPGMSMVLLASSKCLSVNELLLLLIISDYPMMVFLAGGESWWFLQSDCFTAFCTLWLG